MSRAKAKATDPLIEAASAAWAGEVKRRDRQSLEADKRKCDAIERALTAAGFKPEPRMRLPGGFLHWNDSFSFRWLPPADGSDPGLAARVICPNCNLAISWVVGELAASRERLDLVLLGQLLDDPAACCARCLDGLSAEEVQE